MATTKKKFHRNNMLTDLERFQSWREHGHPKNVFLPWSRLPRDVYTTDPGTVEHLATCGMYDMFGITVPLVRQEFRDFIQKVIEKHGVRMSPLRAIMQGEVPGIPAAAAVQLASPSAQRCLTLCDCMETLMYDYIQESMSKTQKGRSLVG